MADRNIFDVNLNDKSSDVPVKDQPSASSSDQPSASSSDKPSASSNDKPSSLLLLAGALKSKNTNVKTDCGKTAKVSKSKKKINTTPSSPKRKRKIKGVSGAVRSSPRKRKNEERDGSMERKRSRDDIEEDETNELDLSDQILRRKIKSWKGKKSYST